MPLPCANHLPTACGAFSGDLYLHTCGTIWKRGCNRFRCRAEAAEHGCLQAHHSRLRLHTKVHSTRRYARVCWIAYAASSSHGEFSVNDRITRHEEHETLATRGDGQRTTGVNV